MPFTPNCSRRVRNIFENGRSFPDYTDYQNARDAAWRLLLDCGVDALPVKVSAICRRIGVTVRIAPLPPGTDGQSLILQDRPVILLAPEPPAARRRFTLAHELGHILLGHVGRYPLVSREPSPTDTPIEQAANVFAARLLAPACVLWGCGVSSADEIAALCDISRAAAAYRWQRLQLLYRRGKFLTHPLERAVYRQFAAYIAAHRS